MPTAKNENILRPNNINTVVLEISNSPKLIEIKDWTVSKSAPIDSLKPRVSTTKSTTNPADGKNTQGWMLFKKGWCWNFC